MSYSIRRLVTGDDGHGNSMLIADGKAEHVLCPVPMVPQLALINLWSTQKMPAEIVSQDAAAHITGLTPSANGSIFRVVDFPPEATYLDKVSAQLREQAFAAMQASTCVDHSSPNSHPFMHRTKTLDYAIVLEGEIYLILDKSEHLMKAGDVAIQNATNHAWSNRSDKMCRVAFILLDAQA